MLVLIFNCELINGLHSATTDYKNSHHKISNVLKSVSVKQRWLFYLLLCYTVLTRAYQLETAVHGCRILLILGLVSIMSLSCFISKEGKNDARMHCHCSGRQSVDGSCIRKFSTQSDQPCRNLSQVK